MATNYDAPDYVYWQNIETGVGVEVRHIFYEEPDTNYYEETFTCEELDQEWYSEASMEQWMAEHGYTDDY